MKKIIAMALSASLLLGSMCLTGCSDGGEKRDADFSGITKVCELASLKCYYHNVARTDTSKDQGNNLFNALFKKRAWIEYDGTVTLGIDAGQVHIGTPNDNGVVKVSCPSASIQEIYLDKDSVQDPVTDNGFFAKLTAEERNTMVSEAQKDMEQKANENAMMLNQATERAKNLIEKYVKNAGKVIGKDYTVEWEQA